MAMPRLEKVIELNITFKGKHYYCKKISLDDFKGKI